MTKNKIIDVIARQRWVEEIIEGIKASRDEDSDDLKDLAQMTYLDLLEKDATQIEEMYENGSLRFYITRMLVNQLQSKTSRYHYIYRRQRINREQIDDKNYKTD